MIERLLIGLLAQGLENQTEYLPTNVSDISAHAYDTMLQPKVIFTPTSSYKFHIGMLSISLLVGLAYGGFVSYMCWIQDNTFLAHIRNLIIALVVRTFFSILFDGVVVVGESSSIGGSNTLTAIECICLNLVVAYWLLLTVYLWARVQRNLNNEPNLFLYQIAIPGIAVFFALVRIFALDGQGTFFWWRFEYFSLSQWIDNSLRLLYLFAQLGLLVDIGRTIKREFNLDNDSVSLASKVAALMGVLVFLFWLHFGMGVGRPPRQNPEPYLYFYHLIDGLQCTMVCPIFYFVEKWVTVWLNEPIPQTSSEDISTGKGNHSIVTIDSIVAQRQSRLANEDKLEESKDVVYSSVVQPEQLKRTLDLYKRLEIIPSDRETVIGGDKFYNCNIKVRDKEKTTTPEEPKPILNYESGKVDKVPKKNAFYSSKYLVVDPKPKDTIKPQQPAVAVEREKKEKRLLHRLSSGSSDTAKELTLMPKFQGEEFEEYPAQGKHKKRSGEKRASPSPSTTEPVPQGGTRNKSQPIIVYPVTSSDSEFEIEKQRSLTTSSDSSFLDNYYSAIMSNMQKLEQPKKK